MNVNANANPTANSNAGPGPHACRTRAASAARRARSAVRKLAWGRRRMGTAATVAGVLRLGRVLQRHPNSQVVQLRFSRLALQMQLPEQLVPALVVFREIIDPEYHFLTWIGRPGWRVIDVGSAIGQFTVFAAVTLPDCHVDAYDPLPLNTDMTLRNACRNGVGSRVAVHEFALGSRDSITRLASGRDAFTATVAPESATGAARPADASAPPESAGSTQVRVLDDLLAPSARVDVLKINVAGGELDVLQGAERALAEHRIAVVFVLVSEALAAQFASLTRHGYRWFFWHPETARLHEVLDGDSLLSRPPYPARALIGLSPVVVGERLHAVGWQTFACT